MFLRPHHFQQQERYLESLACQQMQATTVQSAGFSHLLLNDFTKAQTGEIHIVSAYGIMSDGLPFKLDGAEVEAINLPVGEYHQWICLIFPPYHEGAEDIIFDDEPVTNARYLVDEIEIDDTSEVSLGSATVQVGKPRYRLCLENDVPAHYYRLNVLKIIEVTPQKVIVAENDCIAQIIQYRASSVLTHWVRHVHSLLESRAVRLAERLHRVGRSAVVDVADLMMLQTINRYVGVFKHLCELPEIHPERVYREFVTLIHELSTFTRSKKLIETKELPGYFHQSLKQSFAPLMERLIQDLSFVMEEAAIRIELIDKGQGLQVAKVDDVSLLKETELVLSVYSELPLETLAMRFPTQSKLGAVEKIRDLVHLQLPGIKLKQISGTPPQLPFNSSKLYFSLEKKGDLWHNFEQSGLIALHLAGDFPGLNMELWALREL